MARRISVPPAVLEIVGGILVGPTVFGWVSPSDPIIQLLSGIGLAFLLSTLE